MPVSLPSFNFVQDKFAAKGPALSPPKGTDLRKEVDSVCLPDLPATLCIVDQILSLICLLSACFHRRDKVSPFLQTEEL